MIKNYLYQLKRTPARIWKWFIYTASPILPDKFYIKQQYRIKMGGAKLNLKNPKTFQEKIQWLKLNYRKPEQTILADKYAVKKWLSSRIAPEHIIPTLGVYERFEDIDFSKLPNSFVLKTTHGYGNTIICEDKTSFDYESAKNKLNKALKRKYWLWTREWAYKNIPPRIIVEPLLGHNIPDYKWFCFNGEPIYCQLIRSRWSIDGETVDFFDTSWRHMEFVGLDVDFNTYTKPIEKPKSFESQLIIAKILSQSWPFVRIDLYEVDGVVKVGEITFYPKSGIGHFTPYEYDRILGDMIILPDAPVA